MKKFLSIIVLLLLFISYQHPIFAAEERLNLFGIGASIQQLGGGEFLVKTEGNKAEEGFVYTEKDFTTENLKYEIKLKGQGQVLFRIVETNARGQYIKQKDMVIDLTEEWKTYETDFILESKSSQIDVLVITKDQNAIEFSFKNLQRK